MHKKYKMSRRELCELYIKASADNNKLENYLKGRPVKMWSQIDDMALMEQDDSPEFQVLLQEKGWVEITERRAFLKIRPVFEREMTDNMSIQKN